MPTAIDEALDIYGTTDYVELYRPTDEAGEWDLFFWDESDWGENHRRLSVELFVPDAEGSVLGAFVLGEDVLSSSGWTSITPDVLTLSWDRGSDDGAAQTGTLTFVLDNEDGRYSPWRTSPEGASSFYGVGTVVRISGFIGPTNEWASMVVGVTESWNVETQGLNTYSTVTVVAPETTSLLARYDGLEQSPAGTNDTVVDRVTRLLDDVEWPYGMRSQFITTEPTTELQETTMAGNRLSELYLSADSIIGTDGRAVRFRAARDGRALVIEDDYETAEALSHDFEPAYVGDSLVLANDAEILVNVVQLSAAGGTSEVYEDAASIERYGKRSTQRLDLICETSTDLDPMGARILAENDQVLRPVTLTLHGFEDLAVLDWIMQADLGMLTTIVTPDIVFSNYRVVSLRHAISPTNDAEVDWVCQVGFRPTADATWNLYTDPDTWGEGSWGESVWS